MFYLQIPDKDFSLIQFPKIILLFALSSVFIIQNMYNIEHKIYRVTSKYYGLGAKSKAMNKYFSIIL